MEVYSTNDLLFNNGFCTAQVMLPTLSFVNIYSLVF